MTELSNSLADLAERIKESHRAFVAAQHMTADKAMETGRLLCEAKKMCGHGEWLPMLARSGVGERWAQRLIKLDRSGLKTDTVSDLGGIKAALTFLSTWRMPTFDETMVIRDPERIEGKSPVGRGATFIWEDEQHRGFYHVGIINGGDDEECVHTKRPMGPKIEVAGERPINTIVDFLTRHFALPIDAWEIGFVEREPNMTLVLAPFWNSDTLREWAA